MIWKSPGRCGDTYWSNTRTLRRDCRKNTEFHRVLPDMAEEDWASADRGRRILFIKRTGNRPPVIWASDAAAGSAAKNNVRTLSSAAIGWCDGCPRLLGCMCSSERPKSSLGLMSVIGSNWVGEPGVVWIHRDIEIARLSRRDRLRLRRRLSGENKRMIEELLYVCIPNVAVTRSPKWKSLWTPKFTPQVPGPYSRVALCKFGIVEHVGANGRQIKRSRVPDLVSAAMIDVADDHRPERRSALKSPTASTDPTPMLPGTTGPQLSQIQKGVKACSCLREHVEAGLPSAHQRVCPARERRSVRPSLAHRQILYTISHKSIFRDPRFLCHSRDWAAKGLQARPPRLELPQSRAVVF